MQVTIFFKSGRSYTSTSAAIAESLTASFDQYRIPGMERFFVWFDDGLLALHEIEQIAIAESI